MRLPRPGLRPVRTGPAPISRRTGISQFMQIWGVWTIPGNLKLPPAPFQGPPGIDYVCSNWIGLDGQRLYLDSSLPQIGTSRLCRQRKAPSRRMDAVVGAQDATRPRRRSDSRSRRAIEVAVRPDGLEPADGSS